MRRLTSILAFAIMLATSRATFAVVAASGGGGPSTTTSYDGSRNDGFLIVEDVAHDVGTGPWLKELVNVGGPGNMLPSGLSALIDETFTNVGTDAWTDWHERILSITNIGGDTNHPGFLFRNGSLSVYRNGGLLAEGSDYQLTTEVIFGQVSVGGDWEALAILFGPGATIQPGDSLRITKDIFEVFGNGKQWELGEAAELAQYPTVPEPSSIGLALIGAGLLMASRVKHLRTKKVSTHQSWSCLCNSTVGHLLATPPPSPPI